MTAIFIAKGNGYAGDTTFDGYEVIAEPLPTRESRILGRIDDKPGTGCDYGSHSIKLAVLPGDSAYKGGRQLYILMQHGGGRVVAAIRTMYDGGGFERALLAMPEAVQYATLYTLFAMADDAALTARVETRTEYAAAFVEGRLRKSRVKAGQRRVTIEPRPAPAPTAPT